MITPNAGQIVLFVDDEPMIRKYFQRIFGDEWSVLTADGIASAREILHEHGTRIAVLLTDQEMPRGDGISLLHEVREMYPHIVRLLTTAYSDIDRTIAAVNRGEIWRYVTKPWDLKQIRETLTQAIELHRDRSYEHALISERRRATQLIASYIAHEMRTPLRSIHAIAAGLERYLPTLFAGYDCAIDHGADIEPISRRHRLLLGNSVDSVQRIIDRANNVIDLLLASASESTIEPRSFEQCDITACVETAVADFPFSENERAVIDCDIKNGFLFRGSSSLMILVLHNLFRNALSAVAAGATETRTPAIRIRAERRPKMNLLVVRDNGTGMRPEQISKIFSDFTSFSGEPSNSGIGLGFCRRVMTSLGGQIDCRSTMGEYTQFDLWFPPYIPSSSATVTDPGN